MPVHVCVNGDEERREHEKVIQRERERDTGRKEDREKEKETKESR